ncbi:MAG: hypothetical protein SGPRY_001657 [Prymnesium sp.]
MSSSEEEGEEAAERAARRARALALLAKLRVSRASTPNAEEARFLRSLLSQTTSRRAMENAIKDRLGVLEHASCGHQSSEPFLQSSLTRLSEGDLRDLAPHALDPSFWRHEAGIDASPPRLTLAVRMSALYMAGAAAMAVGAAGGRAQLCFIGAAVAALTLAARSKAARCPASPIPLRVPVEELREMASSLNSTGYSVLQPSSWSWGADEERLGRLQHAARTFASRGWPPVFVFMLEEAWETVDKLWEPMRALLGQGCTMDPSVFCWIACGADALPPAAGKSDGTQREGLRVGGNFGTPHRDFTCLQSLRSGNGEALLLSLWLPLSHVSPENGCMMVVPRQLDPHYTRRFAYAHMRPALASDDDADVTEVRFDLQAARPLAPLKAGSLVAWCGNVIHWGTRCSPGELPRVSVGFNFLREGEALQSGTPTLTQSDLRQLSLAQRLSLISRSLIAYSPWYNLNDSPQVCRLFQRSPPPG